MIDELKVDGKVVALLLSPNNIENGAHPVSEKDSALQVLMMRREAGYTVEKHTHKKIIRSTNERQKALVLIKGAIEITVCDDTGKEGIPHLITAGQCLFLKEGGYSLKMKEGCVFYEFKNGPHTEDKVMFS
jgi:hypothetical protein